MILISFDFKYKIARKRLVSPGQLAFVHSVMVNIVPYRGALSSSHTRRPSSLPGSIAFDNTFAMFCC